MEYNCPKPVDSNYVSSRSSGNDGIHIVVVDDSGNVSGVAGNILEKHLFLSKAKDTTDDGDAPTKTYYKDYLALNSANIFAGHSPSNAADAFMGNNTSSRWIQFSLERLTPLVKDNGVKMLKVLSSQESEIRLTPSMVVRIMELMV